MRHASSRFALAIALMIAAPAWAANCGVSAVALPFGNYTPLGLGHDDVNGDISVTCDGIPGEVVSYTVMLSTGSSGSFSMRRMRFGAASFLSYNLYTGVARTVVWGDGTGGSSVVADSARLLTRRVTRSYPVFGRAFAGQNVPVGIYTDTIVVTLNF